MEKASSLIIPAALSIVSVLLCLSAPAAHAQQECERCSKAAQTAEYESIYQLYRDAVASARMSGFKCSDDPDYSDQGGGNHTPGNCADWQRVTWESIVERTWQCWTITKIRARHKFSFAPPVYHHFVSLTPKCGGKRIYLDPWENGVAVASTEEYFRFATGFFSWWIHYPQEQHTPGSPGQVFQ